MYRAQFSSHCSRNVADLRTHDIVHANGIAVILIGRLPLENDSFFGVGMASVEAHTHDLSRYNACRSRLVWGIHGQPSLHQDIP